MDQKLIPSLLIGALILWSIFRRVRRNIGRQRVSPKRMGFRIGLLGLFGLLAAFAVMRDVNSLTALLAGIAGGAVLARFSLQLTKFETTPEGTFYVPHTYIGLMVSALLLLRIGYRFLTVYPAAQAAAQAERNPFAAYHRSPLTLAIFGVVVGYYVLYYIGILQRSRLPSPQVI